MIGSFHGHHRPYDAIASMCSDLGKGFEKARALDAALKLHELSLETYEAVHGSNKPHRDTATSLNNIGRACIKDEVCWP